MSGTEPTENLRLAGRMAGQRLSPAPFEAPPPPALPAIRFDGLMMPEPQRPFGLFWIALVTALALVAGLLIMLPASVTFALIDENVVDWEISQAWSDRIWFATSVVLYAAAFLALPWWFLRRRRSQDLMRWRKPRRSDVGWALVGAGASWGALLAYIEIAGEFAPDILRPDPIIRFGDVDVSVEWLAFYAFLVVIAAPLAEEGFFRGFLLGGLRRARSGAWGRRIALVLTAALFAAAHFYVHILIPIAVTGLIFSLLFIRTGNLTTPTLAHFGHNAVAFIVTLWVWGYV